MLVIDVLPRACRPPLLPEQLACAVHLSGEKARGRPPKPKPKPKPKPNPNPSPDPEQVGQMSVLSFAETTQLLHPFERVFSAEAATTHP